ncbi:Exoglucanase B precursor [compost metagenome]
MLKSSKKLDGLGLLISTLKSFNSIPFCRFLGNYYEDTQVTEGNSYRYRIVKASGSVTNPLAESVLLTMGSSTLNEPVDSLNFKTRKRAVDFRWKPEPDRYYGVKVFRSETPDSIGRLVTKDPILISTILDPDGKVVYPEYFFSEEKLTEKKTYYYTFVGVGFFGEHLKASDPIRVRIKDETLPEAPSTIQKVVYGKAVQLNWYKEYPENDFAGYRVYQGRTKNGDSVFFAHVNEELLPFADSSYRLSVPEFGLYFFKVAAVDDEGNEAYSAELVVDVIDNEPPAIPANVRVISDTARLVITWDKNQESDILGYKIYRSIKNDQNNLSLRSADLLKENIFYDSLPANALNGFTYAVIALDTSLNESKLSAPATNVMVDILPPKQPFLKQVYRAEDKVVIEWVRNTELDLVGYKLFRITDDDTNRVQLNKEIIPKDISNYYDRTTEPGKSYHYFMVALDLRANCSKESNRINIKIKSETADVKRKVDISKVKYEKVTGSVKVSWKSNPLDEQVSYVLFKRTAGNEFKMLTPRSEVTSFRDQSVKPGDKIEYQVRMYNPEGKVVRSEVVSFLVPDKKQKK